MTVHEEAQQKDRNAGDRVFVEGRQEREVKTCGGWRQEEVARDECPDQGFFNGQAPKDHQSDEGPEGQHSHCDNIWHRAVHHLRAPCRMAGASVHLYTAKSGESMAVQRDVIAWRFCFEFLVWCRIMVTGVSRCCRDPCIAGGAWLIVL
jgi:hypothetical protein